MKIIGHRGARGLVPENTIASLKKGLQHHVDLLEFDLRVTKDNVVILHHDPHLTDAAGNKYAISTTAYAELKEHKADLAAFEEVINDIGDKTTLFVEIKPEVATAPIIKIIKKYYGKQLRNFWLGSKSQSILLELHRAFPDVPKVVIEPWSGVRAHRRARQVNTHLLAMNQLWLWSGFIRSVARGGNQLYAYTLNDPKKAARWAKHGLAGVVTDYPDRFEHR